MVALPPPLPPPLCPLFGSLVNLLQCDVLLAVESAVLQWAMEPGGGGWTESMLQRVSLSGARKLLCYAQLRRHLRGACETAFYSHVHTHVNNK